MINAGYYLYPTLLLYCEIIPSVYIQRTTPSLPMYFCENFDHHMVYFMKYLSVLRQPTLIFSHHEFKRGDFCLIAFFQRDVK